MSPLSAPPPQSHLRTAEVRAAPSDVTSITAQLFREVVGHFATGVAIITTGTEERLLGTTASAVTALSDYPPSMLVCLNQSSVTADAIAQSGHFAVNILAEDQHETAQRFAKKGEDKFGGQAVSLGFAGDPLLDGVLAQLECRVTEKHPGGTHTIYIGLVQRASTGVGSPLTYYRGGFGRYLPRSADADR